MSEQAIILVLNSGSSSIKFDLYAGMAEVCKGQISGLGDRPQLRMTDCREDRKWGRDLSPEEGQDHETALLALLSELQGIAGSLKVEAVGHRIVHGGHLHSRPRVIDTDLIEELESLVPLAPLHQPHNLSGVYAAQKAFPDAKQVACFDTAFHRHHPWVNDTFALPSSFYEEGIRRYGFHGLSYEYICTHLQEQHPEHYNGRLVVAHLGNGASMCGIRDGKSVGSTMGFTALDGLPMGTRCGQLDPGVVLYLLTTKGMNSDEVSDLLYKHSGLKGLSGISQDMQILSESDEPSAQKAIEYFVFRIRRELGAMAAILNGLDTLVFTGGIGENAVMIRDRVCKDLDWLGLGIDTQKNRAGDFLISSASSSVNVLVVPTNEEEMIRRHTQRLL